MSALQRVAWVTGAGRGIGEISARMLAAAGYKVAVSARTAKDIEGVADSIVKSGGVAVAVACDVTLPASVVAAADRIRAALGPVGVLVNNAGAAESHKFVGHDDELWRRMLDANLNSVYFVTKSVVADMVARELGPDYYGCFNRCASGGQIYRRLYCQQTWRAGADACAGGGAGGA